MDEFNCAAAIQALIEGEGLPAPETVEPMGSALAKILDALKHLQAERDKYKTPILPAKAGRSITDKE